MSITLVVKAPNQKYVDQSFNINLTWTVKQLKSFLSTEYPSKPAVEDQRLIYSGHLLKDDQTLSQVFQPISSNDSVVTIHLVVAQKAITNDANTNQRSSENTSSNNNVSSNSSTNAGGNSGQRETNLVNNSAGHNESQSQSQAATAAALTASMLAQMNVNSNNLMANLVNPYANSFMPGTFVPIAVPPTFPPLVNGQPMNLSPEEMNAMQQLYSRLLSNYSPTGFIPGVIPSLTLNPFLVNGQSIPAFAQVPLVQPEQLQQQQQQRPQVQQQQNRPQPPILGPAPIEDDEEADNRDWLDWFYWISRALVLFSIVYFYSSFTRFILVVGFAVFMYLYQVGLFFPRNAIDDQQQQLVQEQPQQPQGNNNLQVPPINNNVNQENEPANDAVAELPVPDAGVAAANDGIRARRRHSAFSGTSSNTHASDTPDERLSGLRMVWVVLSSLFTSLIPEQPQVNFH